MKSKITMLLLSLVIAFILWFYVISVVSPDSEISIDNVAVQTQGEKMLLEQSNLMVVTDMSELKVDLVLEGNRTDLIKLNHSNITITVDVSKIDRAGEHDVTYTIAMPGDIPSNAVSVKTREPDLLTIRVENRILNKEIPLELNYDETDLEETGYIVRKDDEECPESIFVSGPESVIKTIDHAEVNLDLTDRKVSYENEEVPYVLYDKNGNVIDDEMLTHDGTVEITLPIQYTKVLPLGLKYIDGGGATAKDVNVIFYIVDDDDDPGNDQPITGIMVSGSKPALEGQDSLILGTVDLAKAWKDQKEEYNLEDLPLLKNNDINNESGVTKVYAKISFSGLSERTLSGIALDNDRNIPTGLRVAGTGLQRIDITVRGPADLVEKLTPGDVTAYVDMSAAEAGTRAYPVLVEFKSDEFKNLGVILSKENIMLTVIVTETETEN